MMKTGLALICLPLYMVVGQAVADEPSILDLPRGARVRVTAPTITGSPLVGTIAALSDRIVTLEMKGRPGPVAVPQDAIARLDRSAGHTRSRGKGALIGAGIGLGAGVLAGLLHGGDNPSDFLAISAGEYALGLGLLGASAGALIGVAIPPGERWEAVPRSGPRLAAGPAYGHRIAISVSLRLSERR